MEAPAPTLYHDVPPPDTLPEETRDDGAALGWLAAYLPSYGTSTLLHVAVGLIAWFLSMQVSAFAKTTDYGPHTIIPVAEKPVPIAPSNRTPAKVNSKALVTNDPKKVSERPGTGRGKFKPGPSSIVREFTENPFPDVAANGLNQLDVIGLGGGGHHVGGWEGLGVGGHGGFFAVGGDEERSSKIAYVVDRSGSMTDSIDFVKYELKRSISELTDLYEFHVIFYSSGPAVENPPRRLVNATERNKDMAYSFVDDIIPFGETDPSKALERAFATHPEVIYLLTDGEFDQSIVDLVRRLNADKKVTIHTICFLYRSGERVLQQIASENGGNYRFVAESDLANLGK
jgi:hypothetical protein